MIFAKGEQTRQILGSAIGVFLVAFFPLLSVQWAHAGHIDVAPIPDEVTDRIKKDLKRGRSPDVLDRHIQHHVTDIEARLQHLEKGDLAVEGPVFRNAMVAKMRALRAVKSEAIRRIAEQQSSLRALGLATQVARLEDTRKEIEKRFDGLDRQLRELGGHHNQRELRARARDLKATLGRLAARRENAGAVADQPIPTFSTGTPVPPSPQIPSPTLPRHMAWEREPTRVALAGGEMVAVLDPVPPAAECGHTAADLDKNSLDAKVTPEIATLAQSLEYSPGKIFEYVASQIEYQPYWGSLKGAHGTLHSKSGGATDQASLLIALLRESNIPARYVRGTVEFYDARGPRWIGAKTFESAASILGVGENPHAGVLVDAVAGVVGMDLAHVWVEACIPYSNYRGTHIDTAGYRWIPLDASFKEKTYQPGIAHATEFDYTGYMARRTNDLPGERYAEQVEAAVKSVGPNFANNTIQDVPYAGKQAERKVDILPSSLPYRVRSFDAWGEGLTAEIALLPDSHRYKVSISSLNSSGDSLLASPLQLSMPEVALQRITLSWRGATGADQTALDAWKSQAISSGVSCSINVVPEIRVDGAVAAVGTTSVGLCTASNRLDLTIAIDDATYATHPSIANQVSYNNIGAANLHALQVFAYQTSNRLLAERSARLLASVRSGSGPNSNSDEVLGEFLHLTGLKYVRYISDSSKAIGLIDGGTGESGHHIGLASSQMRVEYLFDLPFAVHRTGLLVDFPGGQFFSLDQTTGRPVWKTFLLSAYSGSAYESYVWQENAKMDAVSTVRGIQFARENNIEILVLNSSNWAAESGKLTTNADSNLNYSPSDVANLQNNYINAGYDKVTIPRSLIQYADWKGSVYIAEKDGTNHPTNPTGSASFVIQRHAGGETLGDFMFGSFGSFDSDGNFAGFDLSSLPANLPFLPANSDSLAPNAPEIVNSAVGPGNTQYTTIAGDPVNMVTGNLYHVERDVSIKGRGLPIVFERSYNSRGARDGPLGFGWTHSFNHELIFLDDNIDGTVNAADTDGITSSVIWIDGTGGIKFIGISGASSGGVPAGAGFTSPKGFFFQVARLSDGTYTIREKNGLTYTFEAVAGTVGQKAKLIKIADRHGNAINLAYTGSNLSTITDSLNRSLTLTYAANRITEIRDWTSRSFRYGYDGAGNLISFHNPLAVAGSQAPVTYEYYADTSLDAQSQSSPLNHAMKKYTLPRGNGMTFEYYADGRVFRHSNTLGETTTFTYNEFRRESVQVNERGHTRRFFFDPNGNPTKIVEENGAERSYTYDCPEPGNPANCPNPFNRLSKRDPLGYVTAYQYDAQGNVTRITLPSGNAIDFSHFTAFNQPGKIKDARGNYTLQKYDSQGNLLQTIRLKSGFGAAVDPATYVPAANEIVAWAINTYDAFGNLQTVKRVKDFSAQTGPTITSTYDAQSLNVITFERSGILGNGSSGSESAGFTHDALGRMKTGVRADLYPVQMSYDDVDRVVQATDGNDNLRNYLYDANGNLLGDQIVAAGVINENLSFNYDLSDRRTQSTNSGGYATNFQFDAAGNVIKVTNPDGYNVAFEYDQSNRVVRAQNERGDSVLRVLDIDGKPRAVTDPNGNSATSIYYGPEREGRLKRTTQPAIAGFTSGRAIEYDYDASGNVVKVTQVPATPASGPAPPARDSLSFYDELNRIVRSVGPAYTDQVPGSPTFNQVIRPVTTYLYDGLGNLAQVAAGRTDSVGTNAAADVATVQMAYTYDDFGRQLSRTNALNKVWTFRYDINGNMIQSTDARGQVLHYSYIYGGRLQCVNKDVPNATCAAGPNLLKKYDRNGLGLVTQAFSPEVTYTYTYDAAKRTKTVTDNRGPKTLTYGWSNGGRLNRVTDNEGNQTDHLYDAVGRLMGTWAPNGDYHSFEWDAGGRLAQKWFPNGVNTQYTYNADNSLVQVKNRSGVSDVVDLMSQHDYVYDGFGSRVRNREKVFQDTANPPSGTPYQALRDYRYTYDSLNRLQEVFQTNGGTETLTNRYLYDVLGNRVREIFIDGSYFLYNYDAANRLTGWATYDGQDQSLNYTGTRSYDDNGNQVSRSSNDGVTTTNSYDALNHLSQVSINTPSFTQSYAYDDQGRRVRKTVPGSYALYYLYQGEDIYASYQSNWTAPYFQFTHGPLTDDPLSVRFDDGSINYFHQDGLGSVVIRTTAASSTTGLVAIMGLMRYDAWGSVIAAPTGSADAMYGYTGREPDETGLVYYRARYYNPGLGRFIQPDPIGYAGGQINLYAYVGSNPVNLTDPSGLIAAPSSKVFNPNNLIEKLGYTSGADASGGFTSGSQSLQNLSPAGQENQAENGSFLYAAGPGPAIDQRTGHEVGRFIGDPNGNIMIEPKGGSTTDFPPGSGKPDTHTLYPNGSNYQRLNPEGHPNNPIPHAHGHLEGTGGPGIKGQGPSIDVRGNVVPSNSPEAHWPITPRVRVPSIIFLPSLIFDFIEFHQMMSDPCHGNPGCV